MVPWYLHTGGEHVVHHPPCPNTYMFVFATDRYVSCKMAHCGWLPLSKQAAETATLLMAGATGLACLYLFRLCRNRPSDISCHPASADKPGDFHACEETCSKQVRRVLADVSRVGKRLCNGKKGDVPDEALL